jgi:biopolymer transport protein ExbB
MKKVLTLLAVSGLLSIGSISSSYSQEEATAELTQEQMDSIAQVEAAALAAEEDAKAKAEADAAAKLKADAEAGEKEADFDMVQTLKVKFIEGDPRFMSLVLICLIIGLALAIERIIYLTMATTNNKN